MNNKTVEDFLLLSCTNLLKWRRPMKVLVKNSKREILLAFWVSIICIIVICLAENEVAKGTAVSFPIELWIDGCNILDFFFPLIVTLPFTWILYYEKKDGFINYAAMRMDKKKYIARKILSGVLVVFIMTFVIYYSGLLVSVIVLKPETIVDDARLYKYIGGTLQAEKPLLFGAVWCVWKAFIGAIISAFGYGIALVVDNLFVVALFPFLYCTIENFVTGTLNLEEYSIVTTYILNRLSPTGITIFNYVAGLISFVIIGTIIVMFLENKKKRMENSEECN